MSTKDVEHLLPPDTVPVGKIIMITLSKYVPNGHMKDNKIYYIKTCHVSFKPLKLYLKSLTIIAVSMLLSIF